MLKKVVTIVICYQEGTSPILEACLRSISRHTRDAQFKVLLVTRRGTSASDVGFKKACLAHGDLISIHCMESDIDGSDVSSHIHGQLLDSAIPNSIDTEYLLTLDSDCFPVADGWLSELLDMVGLGSKIAGILHPWEPPPSKMSQKRIEWRVRNQHCWKTTHVACQLVRVDDLAKLGRVYNEGDDTGLAIPMTARELGWTIEGFRVTRCPKPDTSLNTGSIDPEFNRYVCLVFGDKVYHHGGFTRGEMGDERTFEESFDWAKERVILDKGAEFLLEGECSYQFKFDREEEIAAEKMQRLFGLKQDRMRG